MKKFNEEIKMKRVLKKDVDMKSYTEQPNVRRRQVEGSGYEAMIIATDQDLD